MDASTRRLSQLPSEGDAPPARRALVPLRFVGATLCLLGVVTIWVSMGEVMARVEHSFNKPYLLTWLVHNFYLILLPPWLFFERKLRRRERLRRRAEGLPEIQTPLWVEYGLHLRRAFVLNTLLFVCVLTWYVSLTRTSLSVNTGIYNSSPAFVFILSAIILKEKVTFAKSLAVALAIGGVVLVAVSAKPAPDGPSTSPVGCAMVVASAAFYALYEVFGHPSCDPARKKAPSPNDEGDANKEEEAGSHHASPDAGDALATTCGLLRTVALMGVWNALLFPGLFICAVAGWESLEWPTGDILTRICIAGSLDGIFNLLLLGGILLSSPLFMSVGSMLTIPGSMLSDRILHDYVMPLPAMGGVILIVAGFFTLLGHAKIDEWLARFMERARRRRLSGYEPLYNKPDLE